MLKLEVLASDSGCGANGGPGMPVDRTLEAIAAMAARLQGHLRCAILVLEDCRLQIAAEHGLSTEDRQWVKAMCQADPSIPPKLILRSEARVKPLITQTAEMIGAVVLFGFESGLENSLLTRQVEDICWIATLAIEQKHLSDELTYRAHHDPLTHLWNRVWMEQEIESALYRAKRAERAVGLLAIGIDRFRVINDVLGHQVGDELLRQIAERMGRSLDPACALVRGEGDEFLVLIPDIDSPAQLSTSSDALLGCFSGTFRIGDHELMVQATIGGSVAVPAFCDAQELLSQAHLALRYAKKQARGRFARFEPAMITVPPERLAMEQHLRFALQKREFEVYYQPQVDLASGELVGVEALLRWKHPSLGFISPGTFIPMAEEIGVIGEIGDWVIDQALHDLRQWRAAGMGKLRMAVNASALQFSRAEFGSIIAAKLRRSQIVPEEFELELTESTVMADFEQGLRQLKTLRSLGILIAVDDFGTGHSSLAYLQQLPIHRLKVDRMFVRGILGREERPPLLVSIIQMAHALGLSVIAEGIETPEQALALAAMGCEEAQGFLFSKPLPFYELQAWAKKRMCREQAGVLQSV
jgi:diguanylate cyclase (GGDEF)-like protein